MSMVSVGSANGSQAHPMTALLGARRAVTGFVMSLARAG